MSISDSQRLQEIMAFYRMKTVKDFARFINRDRPDAIYNTLKGQEMSEALKKDIIMYCVDFNPEWVRSGAGEKFRPEGEINKIKPEGKEYVEGLKREIAFLNGRIAEQEKWVQFYMNKYEECKKSKKDEED